MIEVCVVYAKNDSIDTITLTGHSMTSQLWKSGMCLITVYDKKGRQLATFQALKVWSITKKRKRS